MIQEVLQASTFGCIPRVGRERRSRIRAESNVQPLPSSLVQQQCVELRWRRERAQEMDLVYSRDRAIRKRSRVNEEHRRNAQTIEDRHRVVDLLSQPIIEGHEQRARRQRGIVLNAVPYLRSTHELTDGAEHRELRLERRGGHSVNSRERMLEGGTH